MKKKIKLVEKKRKLRITPLLSMVTLVMFIAYIFTSVFLQSYNTQLASDIEKNSQTISTLQESVNATALNVRELSTKERIANIVNSKGLSLNPDNVITIGR